MPMEEKRVLSDNVDMGGSETKVEEGEDGFRSRLTKHDLKEFEEDLKEFIYELLDEPLVVKMFFKGVSVICPGDTVSRVSGIGVVMEWPGCTSPIQVQKRLDFYVEELVADYLALLDGLSVAIQQDMRWVSAFTDSEILHRQIVHGEVVESPLLVALRQRVLEKASKIGNFVLKLVPVCVLHRPLSLAQVFAGIVSFHPKGEESTEICSIYSEEKLSSIMLTIKCSHKFCSDCMKTIVEKKMQCSELPISCPQLGCWYYVSTMECSMFLTVDAYESLERALFDANVANWISCPYSTCSVLLGYYDCLSTWLSSSRQYDNSCMECPVCQRFICIDCAMSWHPSMACEEYQSLSLKVRDTSDLTLQFSAQTKGSRRYAQCSREIESIRGCYSMSFCGDQEFCCSCGAACRVVGQTFRCAFLDDKHTEEMPAYPAQELEQCAWNSFVSFPMMINACSDQDQAQLAMIQQYLAGGFSLNHRSPPCSTDLYVDLSWVESLVSAAPG